MANSITMMTIAPNAAKIESTFTNIVVKTYAVTIYFATSKNHLPISLYIFIKFLYFCMQKYEEKMKRKNFYQEKNVPRSVNLQL
mgnify:FL=1